MDPTTTNSYLSYSPRSLTLSAGHRDSDLYVLYTPPPNKRRAHQAPSIRTHILLSLSLSRNYLCFASFPPILSIPFLVFENPLLPFPLLRFFFSLQWRRAILTEGAGSGARCAAALLAPSRRRTTDHRLLLVP